jgi:Uma2 family endonuclease
MTQAEFHRRYETYPEDVKFELIGGVVYMASPLRLKHSGYTGDLGFVLGLYRRATPGVEDLYNATTILGEECEPQPDLGLRILPEFGGQTRNTEDDYVEGPPEMLTEIAHSTRAIDMHLKRKDYQQAGVLEYLVLCVEEQELHWFHFPSRRQIKPDRQGVYRSRVFPGLWIHGPGLLARESARVTEILQQGLASREHAAFVKRLQAAHRKRS